MKTKQVLEGNLEKICNDMAKLLNSILEAKSAKDVEKERKLNDLLETMEKHKASLKENLASVEFMLRSLAPKSNKRPRPYYPQVAKQTEEKILDLEIEALNKQLTEDSSDPVEADVEPID